MIYRIFVVLILLTGIVLSAGCISNQTGNVQSPVPSQASAPVASPASGSEIINPEDGRVDTMAPVIPAETSGLVTQMERAPDMDGFISTSFPKVTEIYSGIKKSRNALDWKQVQDQSLKLQIFIQDLKKTYQLDVPNPEKNVFPGLDSRQQIVLLKYLQYLDDMEGYATNLKNAIYYQEKGTDPQSAQTSRRYQGLADQSEKQAIAEVKTISEYSKDFKFTFFDSILAGHYRYVG